MDAETVENLRKVYNKEFPESQIPPGDFRTVWKNIQKHLHKQCNDNTTECIINSMMEKPDAPESWTKNPMEWLSSDDIDKLEKQFMKLFPHYRYLGSVPIDFDKQELGKCLVDALCSIKLKDLFKKDYQQIGIVFNTDISTGPGQHWIALFCDIRPELEHPRITYFDSYANKPEPEIQRLMRRWKQEWDATQIHSKPMKMTYNNTRHQYEDSECGMYSLYFHYCCLLELSMKTRIPDSVVRAFRSMLFSVKK
jgi:hypothetical protein